MKRPGASVASVPTCSASSTGFQSGRRKSAPNGSIAPLREAAPQDRHVLVVRARRGVMIADEERIEARAARGRRALDHVSRTGPSVDAAEAAGERDADLLISSPALSRPPSLPAAPTATSNPARPSRAPSPPS